MENRSEPSMQSAPADIRPTAYRVPAGDGAAGHRDSEPSHGFFEERACARQDRIAEYVEDFRTSLRIVVSVYARCMEKFSLVQERKFDRVTQSLGNLRALVQQQHSRRVVVEDSRLESPITQEGGCPERLASSRRPDAQPFSSAERMAAFAYMAAELDSTRQCVRQMERTSTAT